MPICKSTPAMATSKKTASDISSDHVTEAAQVKRIREQAYFNSYDFDAIEVLPYDEDNDEEEEEEEEEEEDEDSNRHAPIKYAYLQRLGAFFNQKSMADKTNAATTAATVAAATTTAGKEIATIAGASTTAAPATNENFLLPRAMLKYSYHSNATTSMPLTASLDARETAGTSLSRPSDIKPSVAASAIRSKKRSTASNASSTQTTDSGLGNSTAPAPATATAAAATTATTGAAAAATARATASHYSTDKSGSSGYYSSHVCSTYSLDEHIYCEPVIDILEASEPEKSGKSIAAKQRPQLQLPGNEKAISQHLAMQDAAAEQVLASTPELAHNGQQQQQQQPQQQQQQLPLYSDKLRILETSIENLDRHLKSFPALSYMQQDKTAAAATVAPTLDIGEKLRVYNQLPTIREGYATQKHQQHQQQEQDQVDDSLMDIDLDAFLLQPKQQQHPRQQQQSLSGIDNPSFQHDLQQQQQQQQHPRQQQQLLSGIDNPGFLNDSQQQEKQPQRLQLSQQQLLSGLDNLNDLQLEENNYKCAKYINSCPENAYRVEHSSSTNSSSAYAKRYEDQLHFQSTRELLEDVRDKIRHLTPTPTTHIPQELEGMIETLKNELESYLQRMNQHSELELRQLCSGLGRQQHVVRLQNALERRRSYAGDSQLNPYESVRDGVLISAREQIMTIRCASDPNFKMKRKSITEIFPLAECYVESTATPIPTPTPTPTTTPTLTPSPTPVELKTTTTTTMITQMQRNLTFHANQSRSRLGNSMDKLDDSTAEWHRKKPSIWEMYYGTNRMHQSLLGKQRHSAGGGGGGAGGSAELVISSAHPTLSYPSSRPESDFTLDLPRAEQLRLKMEKEKKFRQRCRLITTFLSLVFFLLTVMVVSLVLTRGKRMFGSMI
ncbi:homeobox protein prospero isoform X2 [Drosophila mojavensis]|uniref:Uncharacterized protein, isoform B n=1 Tax=Drosophila mojavensis TaxID=7230 RepID=A0A0Q9XI64_DROMO|nr:homeobox protein prospero isoform X2 [Drosophila mojavensis]KRG03943.1 uncharacterized protein Dmoj_GI19785, isoform B [Drosophila mojavensis]